MIDTGEDDTPRRLSPRFYNIAVRRLGYTHTEAGRRTLAQLADELDDLTETEREAADGSEEDLDWMEEGRVI